MLGFFLTMIVILCIIYLPEIFSTYSDMDYVKHLEDMGVFVDEDGKQI